MEDFFKGAMLGMLAGVCVGAVIVAKNKKLAGKIKDGLTTAEGKLKQAKEDLQEKLSNDCNCEEGENKNACNCEQKDYFSGENNGYKDFSKKSKK